MSGYFSYEVGCVRATRDKSQGETVDFEDDVSKGGRMELCRGTTSVTSGADLSPEVRTWSVRDSIRYGQTNGWSRGSPGVTCTACVDRVGRVRN